MGGKEKGKGKKEMVQNAGAGNPPGFPVRIRPRQRKKGGMPSRLTSAVIKRGEPRYPSLVY